MSRTRRRRRRSGDRKQPPVSYRVSQDITKNKAPEVKRNVRGDVIYASQYVGDEQFEYWVEYDSNGRPVWYHDSRGYEWRCKYNSKGNISNYWDNTGYEERYDYYINNIVIRTNVFGDKIKKVIDRDKFKITRDVFLNT